MAKLSIASDETIALINDTLKASTLGNSVEVKVLSVKKQRQVIKVKKSSPTEEVLGKCPESIIMIVCENVFDRLDDSQRRLIVEDAISTISIDYDKDKIVVTQPQIQCTVGGRQKYGSALLDALETAVLVAEEIAEEEKEKKEAEKAAKKNKNN